MPNTGPDVVLIRHGETEWSVDGRHTGSTDIPLTDEGRRQARDAGERIAELNFELILSSPLSRALETCRLAGLGDHVQVRDDLREWDYGDYEGITTAQVHETRPDWYLFEDGCPGGETTEQVGERVDRVIAEARAAGGDVAMFGHGHCLRVLAARWLAFGPEQGGRFGLSTATVSVMGEEHGRPAVWLWNDWWKPDS